MAKRFYRFEVIDTGVGIPQEMQAWVFESFAQDEGDARRGGTGLGLTIAKKMVELMGGEIGFESKPGRGSRFFFTVPLPPAAGEVETPSTPDTMNVSHLALGCHVNALVVDDVPANRDVLKTLLFDIGVETHVAENGRVALEQIRTHRFDIVFMDIRMPVMDGIEAIQQIDAEFGENRPKMDVVGEIKIAEIYSMCEI